MNKNLIYYLGGGGEYPDPEVAAIYIDGGVTM